MKGSKVKIGNYRWAICALLFFAATINYIDRSVFSFLKPTLQKEIGWTESEYGYIISVFSAMYALGLLVIGWLIDKVGTKRGYAASVTVWSFAAIGHAFASTPFGFGVAEWFPQKERALATGIFNSGANVGAFIVPIVVPRLTLTYGRQAAFIATGALGFIWIGFWQIYYIKTGRT